LLLASTTKKGEPHSRLVWRRVKRYIFAQNAWNWPNFKDSKVKKSENSIEALILSHSKNVKRKRNNAWNN
jgi:hypothetical protein